jgi:hypothetical protein
MKEQIHPSVKKPYQEPRLRVYGDIQVLTQGVGNTASLGDSSMIPRKTA